MIDIFNYDKSWLNPALKLVIMVVYIMVAYGYVLARRLYNGDLRRFFSVLLWMGIVGAITALLRYFGDGTQFGFTKEFSLKWFQSLGFVVQAILFIVAVRQVAGGIVPDIREHTNDHQSPPAKNGAYNGNKPS
jgi:hypothetical protein